MCLSAVMKNGCILSILIAVACIASYLSGCSSPPPPDMAKINAEYDEMLERARCEKNTENNLGLTAPGQMSAITPTDAAACYEYGVLAAGNGNLDSSIGYFTEAIRLNPQYGDAYIGRGISYTLKDDFDNAMLDFNEAVRLDSKDEDVYYFRGLLYSSKGESELAIKDFDRALRLNNKYADAYMNRGMVYDSQGDLEQARFNYCKTIELISLANNTPKETPGPPTFSPDPSSATEPKEKRRRVTPEQVKEKLMHTLGISPEQLEAELAEAVGLTVEQVEAFKAAVKWAKEISSWRLPTKKELQQSIRSAAKDVVKRAENKIKKRIRKRIKKFLAKFEKPPPPEDEIKLTVNPADVHFRLASVYSRKGEINGAIAHYTKTVSIDPQYAEAYFQRAVVYSAVQEYILAISDGEEFLMIEPDHPRAGQMRQWITEWIAEWRKQPE